jgi:hypothetical protein
MHSGLRVGRNSCGVIERQVVLWNDFYAFGEPVFSFFPCSWAHLYKRVIIFDCRYDFEFDGGHIDGQPPWLSVCITLASHYMSVMI